MRRFGWLLGAALFIGCAQSDSTGPATTATDNPAVETATKTVVISVPGMT